jgi:hypothetical protein
MPSLRIDSGAIEIMLGQAAVVRQQVATQCPPHTASTASLIREPGPGREST